MKKTILVIVLAFPFVSIAQGWKRPTPTPSRPADSIKYYDAALKDYLKTAMDSIKQSEGYKMLEQQVNVLKAKSHNYSSLVLVGDLMHSDFEELNQSIAANGFPAIGAYTGRFGYGSSSKTQRLIVDFYLGLVSFGNRSKKDDEKISSSLASLLLFDFGIDLLKSDVVSLYPYVGFSGRIASIHYTDDAETNPNYTNISNIVLNNRSANYSSFRIGYQAGLGLDVAVGRPAGKLRKTILFVKGGTNGPFWEDTYKIHGIKYKPNIRHADWLISFGIKFATRK